MDGKLPPERAPFADKLIFFMLLVLGIPSISCAWMARYPSVVYWIGQSGTLAPAGCMMWVILGNDLFARKVVKPRLAVVLVLVLPIVVLMIVAHTHKVMSTSLLAKLETEDCISFPQKLHLDKAWHAAHAVLNKCVEVQANLTGAPASEVEAVTWVQRCPDYADGLETWGKEWDYLESLESSQRCAGWCDLQVPLWRNFQDYRPRDRCSLAVATIMGGEVHRTARQVVVYCFFVLIFLGILFSMIEL